MPRQVSPAALQDLLAQEATQTFIQLIEINHPDLPSPLYFTDDSVDFVRAPNTYLAMPFSINLPNDDEDSIPVVKLKIPSVDQSITESIRSTIIPPVVKLEVVARETGTTELGPIPLKTVSFDSDEIFANFTLSINRDILNDAFPKGLISPGNAEV